MAIIETGNDAVGVANVDTGNNLKVTLPTDDALVGKAILMSENDPGEITLAPYLKSPETSLDYRLRTGRDTNLFTDSFNATTQNTNNWYYAFATMTASQPGAGTVNFGTVQGTTAAHGAYMRTFQHFPLIGAAGLTAEFTWGQFVAPLISGEVWLNGFGSPVSAILKPTDGVYYKLTSAGLEGIICYNNTETSTGIIYPFESLNITEMNKFVIVLGEREVEYWKDDVLLTVKEVPASNGQPFLGKAAPVFMQKFNTGNVSNTNTMRVADVTVQLLDIDTLKPWAHLASGQGANSIEGQNGQTQGSTAANFAQAATPTTAAGTNTTANVTGLGGYGVMTAQATNVAAAHDMIATSFLNPASTLNITGRNLNITGVWVSAMNTGAVVATTPTSLAWGLAKGHTAVSLVTAESASFATATTHSPRRIPLGMMSAPIGTVVGGLYDREIVRAFDAPIVVHPGEYIATTVHFRVGTATASQEVTYIVGFNGYWD